MKSIEADYVIVGAGSAGCVLAGRLSEDPGTEVILLEAGGRDRKLEIHVPAASQKLHRTKVDWALETEPQEECGDRKVFFPRGKVWGGSSSTNTMLYIRGQPEDYDAWAELGNPGWSFEELLPYFKKSEDYAGGPGPFHGTGGPLRVEPADARYRNPLWDAFIPLGGIARSRAQR